MDRRNSPSPPPRSLRAGRPVLAAPRPGPGPAPPTRSARAARPHRRLAALLPRLRSAPAAPLLLAWQQDAAILWEIAHAAPAAAAFGDAAWAGLWAEVDRALYGPAGGLPADWGARAEAALAAKPAPAFVRRSLFRAGNLLPWLFTLTLAVLAAGSAARAADPAAAYRRADFAGAEQGWRAAAAKDPADWTARYNLSLALAQQNRWEEAAAQATAAFVQQPANASVRWQFALACDKAGFVPEPLAGFLAREPAPDLAQLASAPDWQRFAVAAAVLGALALAALLALGYDLARGRGPKAAALGALFIAAAMALAAATSWHAYGMTHEEESVIVWRAGTLRSIPTEADTTQKTTPLGAGTIAVADRAFLGWVRLTFDNGQTGWVRKDEVIGLWR